MLKEFILDEVKGSLDEVYKKIAIGDNILRNIEICIMMAKGVSRVEIAQKHVLSYNRICDVINSVCAFIMYMFHMRNKQYYKMFERVTPAGRHVIDYRKFVSPEGIEIFEYLKHKAENDDRTNVPYRNKLYERVYGRDIRK